MPGQAATPRVFELRRVFNDIKAELPVVGRGVFPWYVVERTVALMIQCRYWYSLA